MENKELAKYLEFTNLYHQANRSEIKRLVDEAIKYEMGGICVAPCWTNFVKNRMADSDIALVTVPNWVPGGGLTKLGDPVDSCFTHCDEIDYIWNVYEFVDLKAYDKIKAELETVRKLTKGKLKVIIEAYYIRVADDRIHKQGIEVVLKKACELVNESGADYIKTDSGLFKRPAFDTLLEDSKLLVEYSKIPCKAAGGIRTRTQVEQLIDVGVKRVGTSSPVPIINSNLKI